MTFSLQIIALLAGGLIIDQRLPDVVYPPAQSDPPPAAVKVCRDGCKCTQEKCQCGKRTAAAASQTSEEGIEMFLPWLCGQEWEINAVAQATIDESALETVAAQAQETTSTITVLTPEWCVGPCDWLKAQLGDGDAMTHVEYVRKEAWWKLEPHESYPLLVDLKTLKKWSQDPRDGAKDVRPRTMDEARAKLGIKPQPKGHVVGLTVGTLPKVQVDLLRELLGQSGRREQGTEPLTKELAGGKAVIPPGSIIEWSTADGVLTLNFTKRPRVIFGGILNQDLNRVVITEKTLTLELPWAPDATFRIE